MRTEQKIREQIVTLESNNKHMRQCDMSIFTRLAVNQNEEQVLVLKWVLNEPYEDTRQGIEDAQSCEQEG